MITRASNNVVSKRIRGAFEEEDDSDSDVHTISAQNVGHRVEVSSSTIKSNLSEDEVGIQLIKSTRANTETIQWLLQNYETAEGVTLPRSALYAHYVRHCSETGTEPINQASYGKLIRSVFLGLKTRRLGNRGHSKYHYYGLRIKKDSELKSWPLDDTDEEDEGSDPNTKEETVTPKPKKSKSSNKNKDGGNNICGSPNVSSTTSSAGQNFSNLANADQYKQQLKNDQVSLPTISVPLLTNHEADLRLIGLTVDQGDQFFVIYRRHCEELLECVRNLAFGDIETCWHQFWQSDEYEGFAIDNENCIDLTRTQLYSICTLPVVQSFLTSMDNHVYQAMILTLIPDVLKPIPSALTQSIRNFAKHLENSLALALQGAPDVIVKFKLDAVSSLAQTLRRYTGLNHLAQAARTVLQNPNQISQMLTDLNRVDFRNIQDQASWVCSSCDSSLVQEIEKSFKSALEKRLSLLQWAQWLDTVVSNALDSYCQGAKMDYLPVDQICNYAKKFLLHWSFYSSLIMRDLTLRSAVSFGSFHLIRLLYDEYMYYLIEQRVCKTTGQTVIAVMSSLSKTSTAAVPQEQNGQVGSMYPYDVVCQSINVDHAAQQHNGQTTAAEQHDSNSISLYATYNDLQPTIHNVIIAPDGTAIAHTAPAGENVAEEYFMPIVDQQQQNGTTVVSVDENQLGCRNGLQQS